jgi:predicted RND superfamily exporter protein
MMTAKEETWLRPFVDFLIRIRFILLPAVIVLLWLAWPVAQRLAFDQSIESLFAENDPHLLDYLESKSLFGGDEFVILAYHDPDLFLPGGRELSPESSARISRFADQLSQVPGVQGESTQHLAAALEFPHKRRNVLDMLENVLVGSDRQTTAVILRLHPEQPTSDFSRAETIAKIRKIAEAQNSPVAIVGEPVQIHDMFRYVEEDGRVLFRVSLGLLSVVILILFRSLRWVVLPLIVVVASILWTEAILVLSGMRLSMVSSMLNSLVTIIGIATVTHVTVHYREKRRHLDRNESLRQTLVELLPAIFWTCLTTAIGFAALTSSEITPVRSFGTMMALASMLVLLATVIVLPGGILIGRWSADPYDAPAEHRLVRFLTRVIDCVEHRPALLSITAALFVVFAAFGFFRLDVETEFIKNFLKKSPIVQSLNFVETRLGGAGNWEVNFSFDQLTPEHLDRVRQLAENLREISEDGRPQLTKVLALTDGLDLVPRLPFLLNTIEKRLRALDHLQPEFESSLYNRERGRMRIVLRAKERQPAEQKIRLMRKVEQVAQETFPEAKTTGLFVLLAFLIDSLLRDQIVSFLLAAVGIGSMMALAFRSLRIGLISMVPNLFPIVVVIGTMGWIGLPINIATAMIASVSMGLTVDSTIHYISAYRRARRKLSVIEALRSTHQGVGRALVFANLALIVGFSVLSLSHFIPLIYFGLLLSVAMIGGLIGDLVLLPLLLQWGEKDDEDVR